MNSTSDLRSSGLNAEFESLLDLINQSNETEREKILQILKNIEPQMLATALFSSSVAVREAVSRISTPQMRLSLSEYDKDFEPTLEEVRRAQKEVIKKFEALSL